MFNNAIKLYEDLQKMDPALAQALSRVRSGKSTPQDASLISRSLYTDTLIPRMGNKMAYNDFLTRNANSGHHVHIDLNDFGQINKLHGERMGDEALKVAGNTIADVSRLFGGKTFRKGGDEITAWFHKPEAAHGFARELRSRLEKIQKIGGTHNVAASMGIGYNPQHAESALIEAKKQLGRTDPQTGKRVNIHEVGNAPTVIHSKLHEAPPQGWTQAKGASQIPEPPASLAPPGLTFKNPLHKNEINTPIPSAEHPVLSGGKFGIMTAENPMHPVATHGANDALEAELKNRGFKYEKVTGKYSEGPLENSFVIHNIDHKALSDLGKRYGQDSVIHSHHGTHKMIYTNGANEGTYNPGSGHIVHATAPEMYYSTVQHNGKPVHFTLNFDFDQRHPVPGFVKP